MLEWTENHFKRICIPTPRLDAESLLAHCLNADRPHLFLNPDRPLTSEEMARYREFIHRRAMREPVALITGQKEFRSIRFQIVPGVLIPRPETEILVEAVLQEIHGQAAPRILEIGTGSGAVAVALASEAPDASVVATDIDPLPLTIASFNAKDAGAAKSISFLASDLFGAVRRSITFDVICSNPPWVPRGVVPTMPREINYFEPFLALDGGRDGLDVIRRIAEEARNYLRPGGALILQIGDGQNEAVRDIFASLGGLTEIRTFGDPAGTPRVVRGRL